MNLFFKVQLQIEQLTKLWVYLESMPPHILLPRLLLHFFPPFSSCVNKLPLGLNEKKAHIVLI